MFEICECVLIDPFPMAVTAIDLDAGQNGYVTFTSSDDNFKVSTRDGKRGEVYATRFAFTSVVYSLICLYLSTAIF